MTRGTERDVRIFGAVFGVVLAAIGAWLILAGHTGPGVLLAAVAAFLLVGAATAPGVLAPVHAGWMRFAFVLGWVNSRILLTVFFIVVLAPAGLASRVFGRDALERRPTRDDGTRWRTRPSRETAPEEYERQY